MARKRSRAVRSAGSSGATLARTRLGPMQFGASRIGWGAAASPAARAMGAVYGQIPRSVQAGTVAGRNGGGTAGNPGATGAYRRILNPWGNNVARVLPGVVSAPGRSARRMPIQDPSEIRIDYPANDPRRWPILGSKTLIYNQAEKANRYNAIVDRAFFRGGYALQTSMPTFGQTDLQYAEQQTATPPTS